MIGTSNTKIVNVENFNIFLPQEELRHTKAQPELHISPLISPPFANLAPISDLWPCDVV